MRNNNKRKIAVLTMPVIKGVDKKFVSRHNFVKLRRPSNLLLFSFSAENH